MSTPDVKPYIYDFIAAVYPEAPDLAMASFDERTVLIEATLQLAQARLDAAELARLREMEKRALTGEPTLPAPGDGEGKAG